MTAKRKKDLDQMTFDFIAEPVSAYEPKKKKAEKREPKKAEKLERLEKSHPSESAITDHFQNLNLSAVVGWLLQQSPEG
jgi:hypothetical protein